MDILKYLAARLREPSTWASIAALLAVAHVNVDPGLWATVTAWGVIAAGVLGVVLTEVGHKTSAQVAEDALAAVLPLIEKQITPAAAAKPALPTGNPAPSELKSAGFVVHSVGDAPAKPEPKP